MRVIVLVIVTVLSGCVAHATKPRGSCGSDPVGMIAGSLKLCK